MNKISYWIIPGLKYKRSPQIDNVLDKVTNFYNLSLQQLCSASKKREVAIPRFVCMHIFRHIHKMQLKEIMSVFPHINDHASIIYGIRYVSNSIENNEKIADDMYEIQKQLIRF